MAEKNLKDLLLHTLKDVYFAEHEILKALPKMAQAAQSADLKEAFETHRKRSFVSTLHDGCGAGESCWLVSGLLVRA